MGVWDWASNIAKTGGGAGGGGDPAGANAQKEIDARLAENSPAAKAASAAANPATPAPVYSIGGAAAPATPAAPSGAIRTGTVVPQHTDLSSMASAMTSATPADRGGADGWNALLPASAGGAVSSTGGTGANGVFQIAPTSSVNGPVSVPLPTGIVKYNPNSRIESDREGLAYQLGGTKNFTADLTAAMQASAAANSANLAGVGNSAANTGAQSQQALSAIGAKAQSYGKGAADDIYVDANQLGATGANLNQLGNVVQNRTAPILDVAQQNNALGQSQDQAAALNQSGANAYSASADAQGRTAPTLDVAQQNDALAQSQAQSAALGSAGAGAYSTAAAAQNRAAPGLNTAQQNAALAASGQSATDLQALGDHANRLGLAADSRAAPQAQLAPANSAIGDVRTYADNAGGISDQALALSQGAAGRGAIAPANYGLSQAMLGQGVNSSQSAQQTAQTLTGLEATQGPSAAQAVLAQGQAAAAAQAMSLARSGRGWGGSAQGLADAQRAQAAGLMTANNQASQLSATEQAAWRQRQASNLSTGAQIANQSSGLQMQAGQQLGQQAQADQAAALQSRAQNDQLQGQLYGYGLQGAQAAGQLTAAAGQQLSQNAIQQAQLKQQATAQNDAVLGQMTALGMQGQQQAAALQQQQASQYGAQAAQAQQAAIQTAQQNDAYAAQMTGLGMQGQQQSAALQQAQAAQYGQQSAQNQQAALQAAQQNDAYSAQMYGFGQQGQQQAAAINQAAAAQYGQQAAQNQQAGLAQSQANDQFATNLYNSGTNAMQADVQGKLSAGQLGLAGIQANGEMASAGATNALAGLSQQQQAATTAASIDNNALLQTGQLAQVQSQLRQNQVGDWLQEYGIKEGVGTAARGQTMQMVGAGLAAAGTAAAFMSDVRAKENIVPDGKPGRAKTYAELKAELSEGDSLLNPPPDAPGSKKPFTLQDTENEYALGQFEPNGVTPGRGSAVVGPGGPEYAKAMGAMSKAQEAEGGKPLGAAAAAAQSMGRSMQGAPAAMPNFAQPQRSRFGLQPLQLTSDVRSKTDVKGDGASASKAADLAEMRRAIAGLGDQAGSNMPERFAPPSGEILESAKNTPSFSYDYKDPAAVGAAPGRQYGGMAQDLAKQPATSSLVRPGPDGKLSVDGARLGMTAYSGLGQLARKQESDYDDLRRRIASLGAA